MEERLNELCKLATATILLEEKLRCKRFLVRRTFSITAYALSRKDHFSYNRLDEISQVDMRNGCYCYWEPFL